MTDTSQSGPTLKDIAADAGVSVAAVSKVLNKRKGVSDATRERVFKSMEDLGYRGRAGRQLGRATIVTLEKYVSNDVFYSDVLQGISAAGAELGLEVETSIFQSLDEMMEPGSLPTDTQGCLLVGVDHPALIDCVAGMTLPTVIINGMDRTMRLSSVSPDYHYGAWRATTHLLELGHRDIVHVTYPYRESIRRRVDGFRCAMEEHDITFEPARHILDLERPENIGLAASDVLNAWLDAGNKMPTAFFCVSDMVAMAVMRTLQQRGVSVPKDVSIIGFDGLPISACSNPPLSSLQTDRFALGRVGTELLAKRITDQETLVQRITLGVDLILGRSVAESAPR